MDDTQPRKASGCAQLLPGEEHGSLALTNRAGGALDPTLPPSFYFRLPTP